ncbi:MAG TPA: 50S ribosomal protein L18 [Candidatus Saccharimonadales bacterium]|nr:50S ribosomal protein L18 [Candidatus Saccharimonadales bacterium]
MSITKLQRKVRTRAKVIGTPERPRLSVKVTNKNLTSQIIDDTKGKTLAFATTVKTDAKGTMTEKAAWLGAQIAVAAKQAKVKHVVFDRGSRIYHGRLSACADAARKAGLEF